jgi:hypothetical protein
MPNFDGAGPLKRGRIIGRGQGSCRKSADGCQRRDSNPENPDKKEASAE